MLDYGIIGNCQTSALVSKTGSIDWMCHPTFSSPSIFSRLLDEKKGGTLAITPLDECKVTQKYIEHTNIIETTFSCDAYAFKVSDFFPRYNRIRAKRRRPVRANYLVRFIEAIRGKPKYKVTCDLRPDYAKEEPTITEEEDRLRYETTNQSIELISNIDTDALRNNRTIELNHAAYILVGDFEDETTASVAKCRTLLNATKKYWQRWVDSLVLPERYKETIIRSALVLKLLTYSPSGSIIAASTTSIPEEVDSVRCWDYRFCWVRDATYCVDALKKIGRGHEAKRLVEFFMNRVMEDDHIQIMYGINGETKLVEETLEHLSGFRNSKPVRVGNAAYYQDQNDIYGELIDLVYLYFVYYGYEKTMKPRYWRFLKFLVNQIKFEWEKKDSGIWEFRGMQRHYTHSKLMCAIGVDRAVKIAEYFEKEDYVKRWTPLRDEIKEDLLKNAYHEEKQAFTIDYDSDFLDASVLLMTYHEFLEPTDTRLINTVHTIYDNLMKKDYLVQRYDAVDDFGVTKSAFLICSFWLIDALVYIGETEKAKAIYDTIITKSNHLGLFSEDIDIESEKLIGNFPQAYTHIAIINSSLLLSEWSSRRKKIDWNQIPGNGKKFLH